ncbi:KR domain-containing protein [Micromonospora sp. M42]|uniref:KR domain-containing protein n=1 Tax=Micromonospora sp. M42 TaxID=457406 RepID=UPI00350E9031
MLAPRLAPAVLDPAPAAALDPDGTVLVTGATGALGGLLARHLVSTHKVRHLLLSAARNRKKKNTAELLTELTALGAQAPPGRRGGWRTGNKKKRGAGRRSRRAPAHRRGARRRASSTTR